MAKIYTSGLTIARGIDLKKTRRLPIKGNILVREGDRVTPSQIVAEADIQGIMGTVKAAAILGVNPDALPKAMVVSVGDTVEKGDLLAGHSALFGLLKSQCKSPYKGVVEMINPLTGSVGIRLPSTKIRVSAYLQGTVTGVSGDDTVTIEARGALLQGIFGIGGEGFGTICMLAKAPDDVIAPEQITSQHKGCLLAAGACISIEVIRKAQAVGAAGIIAGAMPDTNLKTYLGHDIGVAITGEENIPLTIILTEGFGSIPMSDRAFELLQSHNGREASFNGATHIRAGVIRPEVITLSDDNEELQKPDYDLTVGKTVR
ncbi:MAG: hypothetical protein IJT95_03635, partial [Abditibacteriota bacterium]|nr:hypothetical protein [Abditibacteriota bacterium]